MPVSGRLLRAWPAQKDRSGIAAKRRYAPWATQDGPVAETPNDLDRGAVCPRLLASLLERKTVRPFPPISLSQRSAAATIRHRGASLALLLCDESPESAGSRQAGRAQPPDQNRHHGE